MNKKFTITFELEINEPQLETVEKLCRKAWGWSYANIVLRNNGAYEYYEADYLRDIFTQIRKTAFPEMQKDFDDKMKAARAKNPVIEFPNCIGRCAAQTEESEPPKPSEDK